MAITHRARTPLVPLGVQSIGRTSAPGAATCGIRHCPLLSLPATLGWDRQAQYIESQNAASRLLKQGGSGVGSNPLTPTIGLVPQTTWRQRTSCGPELHPWSRVVTTAGSALHRCCAVKFRCRWKSPPTAGIVALGQRETETPVRALRLVRHHSSHRDARWVWQQRRHVFPHPVRSPPVGFPDTFLIGEHTG